MHLCLGFSYSPLCDKPSADLVWRFSSKNGENIPLVVAGIDQTPITGEKAVKATTLLEEIIRQRHLIPTGWASENSPSVQPEDLSKFEINPTQDAIIVTPGRSLTSSCIYGRHCMNLLVKVPEDHVMKIQLRESKSGHVWSGVSLKMAPMF